MADAVYDHPVLSAGARRALTVVAAVGALVLGLLAAPAQAADGQLTGTVTGAGAGPVAGIAVAAYRVSEDGQDVELVEEVMTTAGGHYTLSVTPGIYIIEFYDYDYRYAGELYDDVHEYTIAAATKVTVTSGAAVTADAELDPRASISGHVAGPLDSFGTHAVWIYDAASGQAVSVGWVDQDGDYEVPVEPGSYQVGFNRLSGFASSAAQFYDGVPEGDGLAAADTLTLAPGQHRDGVDAVLVDGGHLTGVLTDSAGVALRCQVQAFTDDGSLVTRSDMSSRATGAFDISGLSTGSYLVRVEASGDCRNGRQFLDGTGGPLTRSGSAADPVAVSAGTTVALSPPLAYVVDPPLVNTVLPSIDGPGSVGAQLRALPGSWTPAAEQYGYKWYADGTPIPAATGSTLTPGAELGGTALTVRVTARSAGHRPTSAVSRPVTVTAAGSAPAPLSVPTVVGATRVGARVTATSPALWTEEGLRFGYEWFSAGSLLQASSSPVLVIPESAYAKPLTLRVRASRSDGVSGLVEVPVAGEVEAGRLVAGRPQRVRGGAGVGRVLRVERGRFQPSATEITCEWFRNGSRIPGERGRTYRLRAVDVGHRIGAECAYQRHGYKTIERRTYLPRVIHR